MAANKENMANLLGGELNRFAARHGLGRELHAARIVGVANQLAAGRYQALTFRAGCLTVSVPTHAARYRIQTKLVGILHEINTELGSELITKIVVRIVPES